MRLDPSCKRAWLGKAVVGYSRGWVLLWLGDARQNSVKISVADGPQKLRPLQNQPTSAHPAWPRFPICLPSLGQCALCQKHFETSWLPCGCHPCPHSCVFPCTHMLQSHAMIAIQRIPGNPGLWVPCSREVGSPCGRSYASGTHYIVVCNSHVGGKSLFGHPGFSLTGSSVPVSGPSAKLGHAFEWLQVSEPGLPVESSPVHQD